MRRDHSGKNIAPSSGEQVELQLVSGSVSQSKHAQGGFVIMKLMYTMTEYLFFDVPITRAEHKVRDRFQPLDHMIRSRCLGAACEARLHRDVLMRLCPIVFYFPFTIMSSQVFTTCQQKWTLLTTTKTTTETPATRMDRLFLQTRPS